MSYDIEQIKRDINYNGQLERIRKQELFFIGASILCGLYAYVTLQPETANQILNTVFNTTKEYVSNGNLNEPIGFTSAIASAACFGKANSLNKSQITMEKLMMQIEDASEKQYTKK